MAIIAGKPSQRFGIKEVADVTFYKINSDGSKGEAKLFLDTLKVSNIEFTAEQSEARGGKGNAPLIVWDYGREATVTLQDALLSMETLALMFEGKDANHADGIEINANTFPGTYWVEGTTYARDEVTGEDEDFTFIIPKAKVQSEVTLTMEAEGDPTVFDMTLRVLRGENGKMMELKKGTVSTPVYTIKFIKASGEVVEYELTKDATLTAPENTDGHKWNPTVVSPVTGPATYVEVANG